MHIDDNFLEKMKQDALVLKSKASEIEAATLKVNIVMKEIEDLRSPRLDHDREIYEKNIREAVNALKDFSVELETLSNMNLHAGHGPS